MLAFGEKSLSNSSYWQGIKSEVVEEAILIRLFETTLLDLFQQGKIAGTVHTCIGQEFSGLAFTSQISRDDIVVSNHRCHGHFIGHKKNFFYLLAELLGKENGVCGGIGGSQHLYQPGFFSSGIQGGILPLAAGLALAKKQSNSTDIVTVFIGDGTLGEGVVYETLNIASKWQLPLLIVCENNLYAQSTSIKQNLAGNILARAAAFDIYNKSSTIHQLGGLFRSAAESIDYVRNKQQPCFHLVQTYRLAPHSKGDDYRDENEIARYRSIDPLNLFKLQNPDIYQTIENELSTKITVAVDKLSRLPTQNIQQYYCEYKPMECNQWQCVVPLNERKTIITLINEALHDSLQDEKVVLLGEDVLSPYGGAFKATKNLSACFSKQVFSTPISEAAIVGIANGLALSGYRPIVEIMFGDFVTLALDQILNHAFKFYQMYNKQVVCPVILRMPMGGYRGYGPTHSQSLERYLVGYDNNFLIALNSFLDPRMIYKNILTHVQHPCIVIENKISYTQYYTDTSIPEYEVWQSKECFHIIKISPKGNLANMTIVTYGGALDVVLKTLQPLFLECEIIPEILVLSQLSPLPNLSAIVNSVKQTQKLLVTEEGISFASIGSEIVCQVHEHMHMQQFHVRRCAALPVPIPAERSLESKILLNPAQIIEAAKTLAGLKKV